MLIDKVVRRARRTIAIITIALASMSASAAMATTISTYSLSDALFDGYADGPETLSGTWSVDFTANTVTALSLVASGTETITFNLASFESLTYTGGSGTDQYEMALQSTTGSPFYMDWQASAPVALINSSIGTYDGANHYQTNLYNADFNYSGVTSPGVLTVTTSAVPEPSAWAMMLVGIGAVGLVMRRRQSVRPNYT